MKTNHVSVHDKRKFLDYLLKKHQFRVTGAIAFLTYLERWDDDILQNVHFISEGVHVCPFGICLSSNTYNGPLSRFYFQSPANKRMHDPYKVMEYFDTNKTNLKMQKPKIFLQVNMPNAMQIPEFASVVVDNPHYQPKSYGKELDDELEELIRKAEIERLYKKIDEALDVKDKALFMQLTESVKQMNANEGELR